jgi:hypothetical protein
MDTEKTTAKGWKINTKQFSVALEDGNIVPRKEFERRLDKTIANGLKFFRQLNTIPEDTVILVSRF